MQQRPTKASQIVRFDLFEVDLRSGDVHRQGAPISLQEQPRRILTRLLESPGELVTRDELRQTLWSGETFVDFEHSLNAAIKRLRDALGDSADTPRFIETVPRRGYRFVALVTTGIPDAPPRLSSRWRRAAAVVVALIVAVVIVVARWSFRSPGTASGERRVPLVGRTIATAAFDPYLQGLAASRRWQADGCPAAERHLLEAVSIDPTSADAYAHLAFCYVFPDRMRRPGWETGPKARDAVRHALSLDDHLALAVAMQGQIRMRYDFDWADAERDFRRAVELDPADPVVHFSYGELLYVSGRSAEGLAALRESMRLDPLNLDHQTGYGFALRSVRRFDEAAAQLRRTLEQNAEWTTARFWLAYTEADRGRHDEAVSEYLAFLRRVVVPARVDVIVGSIQTKYEQSGWEAFWQLELELAEEDNRAPGSVWRTPASYYSGPFSMARRYARLGNRQAALDWLEKAFTYRHHLMVFIDCEPLFDALHGERQFENLRKRVGLKDRRPDGEPPGPFKVLSSKF